MIADLMGLINDLGCCYRDGTYMRVLFPAPASDSGINEKHAFAAGKTYVFHGSTGATLSLSIS